MGAVVDIFSFLGQIPCYLCPGVVADLKCWCSPSVRDRESSKRVRAVRLLRCTWAEIQFCDSQIGAFGTMSCRKALVAGILGVVERLLGQIKSTHHVERLGDHGEELYDADKH